MTRQSRPADAAQLPSLYHPWIEALLGGVIPAETEAACGTCAMLPGPGDAPAAAIALFFDPRVKMLHLRAGAPEFPRCRPPHNQADTARSS